ncbi:hypothetical protein KVR01_006179 [Diaporthe batatas]|uniref:uncharacterized protein n=1 Tax=Diaporthe batatas TaxID=748121 RepID=UPI001D04CD2B|nr:uncharacterized protein KVR01_006179 [Diaporthe batatas]KAG8164261.1 hypothetical protein KVR01_006179 [Diaporthe batatas]
MLLKFSPECFASRRARQDEDKDSSGDPRINMSFEPPGQGPNGADDGTSEEERTASGTGRTRYPPSPSARACATTTPTERVQLRSACDACHQSKIKCPGGHPCFPCQSSRNRCNYSPGNRLGRPKGSKNKRTLMREGLGDGNLKRQRGHSQTGSSAHGYDAAINPGRNNEASLQWANRGHHQQQQQQQQQLDQQLLPAAAMYQMDFEVEFDQGFHAAAAAGDMDDEDHARDNHSDILRMLDPDLVVTSTGGDASSLSHAVQNTTLAPQISIPPAASLSLGQQPGSAGAGQTGAFHNSSLPESPRHPGRPKTGFSLGSENGSVSPSNMGFADPLSSSPYSVNAVFSAAGSLGTRTSDGSGTGPRSMADTWSTSSLVSAPSVQPRSCGDCTCLPRLVKLVYQLEGLRYSDQSYPVRQCHQARRPDKSVSSINLILRGVQLAEAPWRGLMHCPNVSTSTSSIRQGQGAGQQGIDDNHNQALLLFATSIRILLCSVQAFNSSSTTTAATLNHDSTISALATDDDPATTADTVRGGGNRSPTHVDDADIPVSVGGVELSGEARAEIIGASVRRSLRVITAALVHLWEHTGRPSNKPHSQTAFPFPTLGVGGNSNGVGTNGSMSLSASNTHALTTATGGERSENVSSLLNTLQFAMDALGE